MRSSVSPPDAALLTCPLLAGIQPENVHALLDCLLAREHHIPKHGYIFQAGENAQLAYIVRSGSVDTVREDYWGNRVILSRLVPGDMFGEAFACAGVERLPISAIAQEETVILSIDYRRIATTCTNACSFHERLIHNMLRLLAQKNVELTQKIAHVTRRSTREKLLSYLSEQAVRAGNPAFDIPFNRQALADYLAVDRSALSSELSKMQQEGLLDYDRNHFALHTRTETQ